DEAERLDTWAVEYDDILRNNPAMERKGREPRASPYKPQTWKGFNRSPIQPRSCCQEPDANVRRPGDSDEDPPSPTPGPSRLGRKMVPSTRKSSGGDGGNREQRQDKQQERDQATKIEKRDAGRQRPALAVA
ncbi:hypothetical protein QBC35DRAFT_365494, partial [Podospora australis]